MNFRDAIDRFKQDERGGVFTVAFLILLPLLIFLMVSVSRVGYLGVVDKENVQQAVEQATKDACFAVNPLSQARGVPHIAYNKAYETFMDSLDGILGLSDPDSPVKGVRYWMVVYNGDADYGDYSDFSTRAYYYATNASGAFFEEMDDTVRTSLTLKMTQEGIKAEGDLTAGTLVTLKEPGVFGLIEAEVVDPTDSGKTYKMVRWYCAKIDSLKPGE